MKKFYLLFIFPLLLLLCFSTLRAQSWVWAEQNIGSKNINDEGESVAVDRAGNVYITGYFLDTMYVGNDTLEARHSFYSSFLIKYDKNGNVLWDKQSLGSKTAFSEQVAYSVATDKLDNVYITGWFTDTSYFGAYQLQGSLGENAFLVKYDSVGNVLWAKQSIDNGNNSAEAWSVATDGNNNAYIAGQYNFNATFGAYTLSRPQMNYFLVKYDPTGNVVWASGATAGRNSTIYSVIADASGNTYMTGRFSDTLELGRDTLLNASYFVAKYNATGKPVWGQQGNGRGYSVTLDAAENVYTTGYYTGTGNFSNISLPNTGANANIFLAKYDSAGKCNWVKNATKPIGSVAWIGFSLAADKYSHIYLLGGGNGTPDIQFDNKTFSLNYGADPLVLVEFDSSGNALCGSITGYGGDDNCGLTANPDGDYVYMGGDLEDTVTFGPDKIGPVTRGMEWIFLAKWQPCTQIGGVSISRSDSICPGGRVQLLASGGKTYSWAPSSGLSCTLCPNPVATPSVTTTYTLTATDTAGNPANYFVTVTVVPLPVLTINPKKDSVCIGGSIAISSGGAYKYRWIPATGLNCDTCNNPTATPTITTTYTVIGANTLGCTDSATATVVITPLPQVTITPLQKICAGDSVTLTATGGGAYQWSNGSDSSSITVKPLSNQSYTVTVTKGCTQAATTSVDVIYPDLFACCDTAILYGNAVTLYAQLSTRYKWIPAAGLNCDSCPNVLASPTVTTTYTVTGTDSLGCQVERVITVLVDDVCNSYNVPNVFTPNGDGVNDVFEVNVEDVNTYSISIYDRWGKETYNSTNPGTYWDGKTESGGDAAAGVYYYFIKSTCKDGRSFEKQGFVQLIR